MQATLRPSLQPKRLAGAAVTLSAIALLAFALLQPITQPPTEPAPETVSFVPLEPYVTPDILRVAPLENIDLPLPRAMVDLPEFREPTISVTLPSLSPATSPNGSPLPSGNAALIGAADGTGDANGVGPILVPPVRLASSAMPFELKNPNRAGLVTSLNFCVTDGGQVRHVNLATTSGFRSMDEIAIDWLDKQRFTPGTLDGVPARMCATYDIRWTYSLASPYEAQVAAKAHATAIRKRSRYPRQFVLWPQDSPFPGCDAITSCSTTVP